MQLYSDIISFVFLYVGGIDYNNSLVNVTFPAGDTSHRAFFDIAIYNDKRPELNETFSLAIVNSSLPERINLGWPYKVDVTITARNGMYYCVLNCVCIQYSMKLCCNGSMYISFFFVI